MKNRNFTFLESDILNMNTFPDVDYIFHQAAQAGVRASWGKSFEIYTQNNILATQRLLEYYKDRQIKKFIYASSSSIYGDIEELPVKEDAPKRPISPYGVTKLAAENLCYLYHKNYGLPAVALRYFTVYGPRQRPDMGIHKFIKAALRGEEITIYGNGEQTRDFTYISDIVKANMQAAECEPEWISLNIGGGSRISIEELLRIIEKTVGDPIRINYEETQKGDVKDTHADTTLAREVINYDPKVNVENGIKKQVDFMKEILNGP
jgi:UDP-glucose 4-epimerase